MIVEEVEYVRELFRLVNFTPATYSVTVRSTAHHGFTAEGVHTGSVQHIRAVTAVVRIMRIINAIHVGMRTHLPRLALQCDVHIEPSFHRHYYTSQSSK